MRRLLVSFTFLLPLLFLGAGSYSLFFGFQYRNQPAVDMIAELPVHHINAVAAGYANRAIGLGVFLCLLGILTAWKWKFLKQKWSNLAASYTAFKTDFSDRFKQARINDGKLHWIAFFILLIYGIAMRLLQVNIPVTYDEAFSYVHFAEQPWSVIISDYSFPNNHVLHSLLLKASVGIFGVNDWGLRLPGLLFGIAFLPVFYAAVRSIFNKHIAIISFALVCSSNVFVEYGSQARGYGMWTLFFVISLWAVVNYFKTKNSFNLLLFGLASVLAFYATPAAVYSQGFVGLLLLWESWRKENLGAANERLKLAFLFAGIAVITVFLYHPILTLKGFSGVGYHPHMGLNTWDNFTGRLPNDMQYIWYYWSSNYLVRGLHIALAVFFVIGLIARPKLGKWLLMIVVVAAPLILLQKLFAPARVWTYVYVIYLIGVTAGLFFVWQKLRLIKYNFLIPILGICSLSLHYSTYHADFKFRHAAVFKLEEAANYFQGKLQPNDRIISEYPNDIPIEYYFFKQQMPIEHFRGRLVTGGYLYIVVNPEGTQSTTSVIAETRTDGSRLGPPEVVYDVNDLKIYRCEVFP